MLYAIYGKDVDINIAISDRYQFTVFLGIYTTVDDARNQVIQHKEYIEQRENSKNSKNSKNKIIPKNWEYYIFECEIDKPIIFSETNAIIKIDE